MRLIGRNINPGIYPDSSADRARENVENSSSRSSSRTAAAAAVAYVDVSQVSSLVKCIFSAVSDGDKELGGAGAGAEAGAEAGEQWTYSCNQAVRTELQKAGETISILTKQLELLNTPNVQKSDLLTLQSNTTSDNVCSLLGLLSLCVNDGDGINRFGALAGHCAVTKSSEHSIPEPHIVLGYSTRGTAEEV